jgi:hypothetical protein
MDGFVIAGKAFCVGEEVRQIAEQNKGKTVGEYLRMRKIEQNEAKQFGMSLEEYRKCINGSKGG